MTNKSRCSTIFATLCIFAINGAATAFGEVQVKDQYVPASVRGLTATFLGGAALGQHAAESSFAANLGGVAGFEFKLRRSSWTLTPELMITYDRISEDKEFALVLTGARCARYIESGGRGVALWGGVHFGVGAHTDDTQAHPAFRLSVGADFMLVPHFGIGAYAAGTLQSIGSGLIDRSATEGGFLDLTFGLRLRVKIPM